MHVKKLGSVLIHMCGDGTAPLMTDPCIWSKQKKIKQIIQDIV